MSPDRPEGVWGEIERLRNWRHDEVVPALASLMGRLSAAEARLQKLEPEVERMARAEAIADAVTANLRARRGQLFSRTEKGIALLVGIGTALSVVLQLVPH
jgi:hypothetical protein